MADVYMVRGVRGAITVTDNSSQSILDGTKELLTEMLDRNNIDNFEDIASVIFSTTADLDAEFPAVAGRMLGMTEVPLICYQEIDVPGSLRLVVRVLMHVNTTKAQRDIEHSYLRGAVSLRPDLNK